MTVKPDPFSTQKTITGPSKYSKPHPNFFDMNNNDLDKAPEKQYSWFEKYRNLDKVENLKTSLKTSQNLRNECKQKLRDADAMKTLYETEYENLVENFHQLEGYFKKYREIAESRLKIPTITHLLTEEPTIYDPWTQHHIPRGIEISIVDNVYHAYPLSVMEPILHAVRVEVKKELPRWIAEISDCDDFADATFTASRMAYGKTRNPCNIPVAWARSRGHAYNGVYTSDEGWMIYEPQSGKWKGKLGETTDQWDTIELRV